MVDTPGDAIVKHHSEILWDLENMERYGCTKKLHWVWWVFPREVPGQSDPHKVTQTLPERETFFQSNSNALTLWLRIINKIARVCKIHNFFKVFPEIDHRRIIDYLLHFPHTACPLVASAVANLTVVLRATACTHFQNGGCRYGDRCFFTHSTPRKPIKPKPKIIPKKPKQTVCKYWVQGGCRNGTKCQFLHEFIPTDEYNQSDAEAIAAALRDEWYLRFPLLGVLRQ